MSKRGTQIEKQSATVTAEKAAGKAFMHCFKSLTPDQLADLRAFFLMLDEWAEEGNGLGN